MLAVWRITVFDVTRKDFRAIKNPLHSGSKRETYSVLKSLPLAGGDLEGVNTHPTWSQSHAYHGPNHSVSAH